MEGEEYKGVNRRNTMLLRVIATCVALFQTTLLVAGFLHDGVRDPVIVVVGSLIVGYMVTCVAILNERTFVPLARIFVFGGLAVLSVAYFRSGLAVQTPLMLAQMLPVLVGAVALGRSTLWAAAGGMALMVSLGAWRDVASGLAAAEGGWLATKAIFGLVVGSLVLDRAVKSMHEGLRMAQSRSDALAQARDRLQGEMLERERVHEQLVHSQRVEMIGRLAGGVAHDFNRLLQLVFGYSRQAREARDPDQLGQALDGIESAAKRASAVARKILDFGRQDVAQPARFDMRAVLETMRPTLRQVFPSEIHVHVLLPDTPQWVYLDEVQFELVILNIAVNAQQAMPEGGVFTAELTQGAPDTVELLLSDTGVGMDEGIRARCTEPFFTTKPSGQGAGLGLAVACQVIQAAGGEIRVDSWPGEGSIFRVGLPRQARAPAQGGIAG